MHLLKFCSPCFKIFNSKLKLFISASYKHSWFIKLLSHDVSTASFIIEYPNFNTYNNFPKTGNPSRSVRRCTRMADIHARMTVILARRTKYGSRIKCIRSRMICRRSRITCIHAQEACRPSQTIKYGSQVTCRPSQIIRRATRITKYGSRITCIPSQEAYIPARKACIQTLDVNRLFRQPDKPGFQYERLNFGNLLTMRRIKVYCIGYRETAQPYTVLLIPNFISPDFPQTHNVFYSNQKLFLTNQLIINFNKRWYDDTFNSRPA